MSTPYYFRQIFYHERDNLFWRNRTFLPYSKQEALYFQLMVKRELNKPTLPAEYDDVPVKPNAILYSIGMTSRRQTVSEKEKNPLTILQERKTRLNRDRKQ
ncbi:hypothetical protein [Xenorhabdus griffiniae]|uniref:hypothetical protein n=1 Tax=Xenorhabdus griffiniae TaxID=351672 RepID=UPI0023596E77|nr:hypothetical protein [Xenorhabdus griffiniae]MDC9605236.1 hypothetical protein [Xenorhabdus griffiniae]